MNVCSCLSGSGGLLSWRQQPAAAGSVLILLRRAAFLVAATPTRSELRGELAVHENKFAATYCAFQASDRISSPISSISNGIRVVSAQSVCVESTLFLFFLLCCRQEERREVLKLLCAPLQVIRKLLQGCFGCRSSLINWPDEPMSLVG